MKLPELVEFFGSAMKVRFGQREMKRSVRDKMTERGV